MKELMSQVIPRILKNEDSGQSVENHKAFLRILSYKIGDLHGS